VRVEQHVAGQVAVDQLARSVDRAEVPGQAGHRRQAGELLHSAVLPRGPVGPGERIATPQVPARYRDLGAGTVEALASGPDLGPSSRQVPAAGPLPNAPASDGEPAVGGPHRPSNAETVLLDAAQYALLPLQCLDAHIQGLEYQRGARGHPPSATPKMLAAEFARFAGLPASPRQNQAEITNAVCDVISRLRVDLVLIDFTDRYHSCS
jgi:hypothetical protein